jgi:hypothetical protein
MGGTLSREERTRSCRKWIGFSPCTFNRDEAWGSGKSPKSIWSRYRFYHTIACGGGTKTIGHCSQLVFRIINFVCQDFFGVFFSKLFRTEGEFYGGWDGFH